MLAYLTALISVVGLSINTWSTIATPRSETTVAIVGSTSDHLLVAVINSGNAASVTRSFSITSNDDILTFGGLTSLKADEEKRFLKSRDASVLHLFVGSVALGPKATKKPFWQNYGGTPVHLHCIVIESDGSQKTLHNEARLADIRKVIEDKCGDCQDTP